MAIKTHTPPYTITTKTLQNVPKNDPINVPLKMLNKKSVCQDFRHTAKLLFDIGNNDE